MTDIIQKLKTEVENFIKEVEILFNNHGSEPEFLKAKVQSRVDGLKNGVDDHCRNHTAQILSDAGQAIPHDTKPADQAAVAEAANPSTPPLETIVGSSDAVAAAIAENDALQTAADVKAQLEDEKNTQDTE